MDAFTLSLSDEFRQTAAQEREHLLRLYERCRETSDHHAQLAEEAARQADRYASTIRDLGELLGAEDQLSMTSLSAELRGERLRDVAAEVLWRHFGEGDVVHYKQWFELVVSEGYKVGGRNPTATFLTQVARVDAVERVARRSGLYRVKAAA